MTLRWFLWTLLSPSLLLVVFVIVGAFLLALGRARAGRGLCILGASGLLIFGVLPCAQYLARPLEQRFPLPSLPPHVDGIVLLAGAELPVASAARHEPQVNEHAGRYITALRLAARYPDARIVHTGNGRDDPGHGTVGGESRVAKQILAGAGVAPARLTFEGRSTDTCTNAAYTRELIHPRAGETWLVVTSAIHMPRTMACFRAVGWNVLPYPTSYFTSGGGWDAGPPLPGKNLMLLDVAAHEWVGLAYYRLTGRTRELFPSP